jgi:hypothetical protein
MSKTLTQYGSSIASHSGLKFGTNLHFPSLKFASFSALVAKYSHMY